MTYRVTEPRPAEVEQLQRAFVEEVAAAYLARSEPADPATLRDWQPTGLAWPLLREVQRRATGMRKRSAVIDGHRLVWMEGGVSRGEPVVLLHGFTSSKENWLLLLPFLLQRYRVYVPDLPGWGESAFRFGAPYSLDAQVARVAEWARQLLPAPAHWVGSSMGGAVAGLFAARHPQLVASVTLMNAAGLRGERASPFEQGLLQGRNGLLAQRFGDVVQLLESVIERNRSTLPLAMAPLMYREFVHRRPVNLHLFDQMVQAPPAPELPGFDAIRAPALVLWGEQDRILDVSCSDAFRRLLPQATVKILRGIGHLPMLEAPALTARSLRRFWDQRSTPALAQAA